MPEIGEGVYDSTDLDIERFACPECGDPFTVYGVRISAVRAGGTPLVIDNDDAIATVEITGSCCAPGKHHTTTFRKPLYAKEPDAIQPVRPAPVPVSKRKRIHLRGVDEYPTLSEDGVT